jgi:hypothetical protein
MEVCQAFVHRTWRMWGPRSGRQFGASGGNPASPRNSRGSDGPSFASTVPIPLRRHPLLKTAEGDLDSLVLPAHGLADLRADHEVRPHGVLLSKSEHRLRRERPAIPLALDCLNAPHPSRGDDEVNLPSPLVLPVVDRLGDADRQQGLENQVLPEDPAILRTRLGPSAVVADKARVETIFLGLPGDFSFQIPAPRQPLARYYGAYANRVRRRVRRADGSREAITFPTPAEADPTPRRPRSSRAR